NNVTITTIPGADGKSLVVYAPQGGYTLGRTYTLCIDQNLTAANGNLLAKSVSMRFVTDALAAGWVEEPAYGFGYIRGAVRPGRADTIKAFYGENNTPVDPEKIKLNLAAGTFTIQTTAVPIFTNVTVKAFKNGVEVLTAADVLKTL
ncbi:MAG: hypothetical protein PHU78_09225, partial [Heliobacteriaceae bacterium]|nr:hypothetical protein [Heliobacteriaceae bacterium]